VNGPFPLRSIRTKLLLTHLLVLAAGVGGLALGVQLVGPSVFDRMMMRHMGHASGMMGMGMTEGMRQASADAFRDSIFQTLLISTFTASIVAVLIAILVSNRITAPLRRLVAGSHRIAAGDFGTRVVAAERDEIGELAETFNAMAAALEDAESRRVRLIGDVAHELRTPLTTLRGNLEGLLDGVVTPEPELWARLHGETVRLGRLVDDLQELSRVESGQLTLEIRPVAPARVIDAALARLLPQYAEKGVDLRAESSDELSMAADETRMVQVLTNLLSNALRYTPTGGLVTISARREGESVVTEVRDTGVGIPAEHLPHIFDRFYRVDRARSRALGGSGIGLTIARALVEAQGGRIWADSPGSDKGSTFSVALPAARADSFTGP
jgi:signal transduction histidine kinase